MVRGRVTLCQIQFRNKAGILHVLEVCFKATAKMKGVSEPPEEEKLTPVSFSASDEVPKERRWTETIERFSRSFFRKSQNLQTIKSQNLLLIAPAPASKNIWSFLHFVIVSFWMRKRSSREMTKFLLPHAEMWGSWTVALNKREVSFHAPRFHGRTFFISARIYSLISGHFTFQIIRGMRTFSASSK